MAARPETRTQGQPEKPSQEEPAPAAAEEHSVGELFKKLRDEGTTLFRQEVELAKVEMVEKARVAARNGMSMAIGGGVAYLGLLFILLGVSYIISALFREAGVSEMTSNWLGPLIVGVVVSIVGYVMLRSGMSALNRESMVPKQTIQSIQEDEEWARKKLKS